MKPRGGRNCWTRISCGCSPQRISRKCHWMDVAKGVSGMRIVADIPTESGQWMATVKWDPEAAGRQVCKGTKPLVPLLVANEDAAWRAWLLTSPCIRGIPGSSSCTGYNRVPPDLKLTDPLQSSLIGLPRRLLYASRLGPGSWMREKETAWNEYFLRSSASVGHLAHGVSNQRYIRMRYRNHAKREVSFHARQDSGRRSPP